MVKEDIPLIYLWVYKKMVEKHGKFNQVVPTKHLLEIIRRTIYQIPKNYDYFFLKDMSKFKLVEKVNMQKYKLMGAQSEKKLRKMNEYFFW